MNESCSEELSKLYEGSADLITTKEDNLEKYVVVEHGDKIFALTVKDTRKVCDEDVWQSEHPKIIIINKQQHRKLPAKMTLLPQNTDLTTYMNSKLLYI